MNGRDDHSRVAALEREVADLRRQLRLSKEWELRLFAMVESTTGGIVLADVAGRVLYCNRAFVDMLDLADKDVAFGQDIQAFLTEDSKVRMQQHAVPTLRARGQWRGELSVQRQTDGEPVTTFAQCTYVDDAHGEPDSLVIAFKDITLQNKLEEQLRQSQKLEAVGTLAGGVAHDMNNVLGAIYNLATLLKMDATALTSSQRQDIEDILYAARRGRDLARNLLGFARKGKILRERLDVNGIIGEVQQLLARTVKRVEVQLLLDDALPLIDGDHGQITQVIMNVCLNAVDAIADKGVIHITTSVAHLEGADLLPWPQLSPGDYVKIEIVDNGAGMDEAVLRRVFEPFFSTKGSDKGTGLGLAMVYGTVKSHGGAVSISSKKGAGSKVTIMLPPATDASVPTHKTSDFRLDEAPEGGRILLVDDEQMNRRSGMRLLKRLGYQVVTAANGIEALDMVEAYRSDLRLVILDLVMPGMDGAETFAHLRERFPEVPVLIASGYTKDTKVDELIARGAGGFLAKPFEVKDLSREIKRLMRPVTER